MKAQYCQTCLNQIERTPDGQWQHKWFKTSDESYRQRCSGHQAAPQQPIDGSKYDDGGDNMHRLLGKTRNGNHR